MNTPQFLRETLRLTETGEMKDTCPAEQATSIHLQLFAVTKEIEFLIFQEKSEIKIFKWNLMILRQLLIQNISICLCRSPSSYLQSERWTSPHISLWTFEDRHWIPRDVFSSRSMPPPSLTLWYISVPNAWLSWMASWLALICLKKKKIPKVQDWERYKEPYRGSDWLDGPAILWLHSIFSFGLLFQDPLFVVSL